MVAMSDEKPRRQRGVRLTDLDRSKVYRIGHTGRRWEVLGADDVFGAPEGVSGGGTGASAEGASTVPVLGLSELGDGTP